MKLRSDYNAGTVTIITKDGTLALTAKQCAFLLAKLPDLVQDITGSKPPRFGVRVAHQPKTPQPETRKVRRVIHPSSMDETMPAVSEFERAAKDRA